MTVARTSDRSVAHYNQHQNGDTDSNQRLLYALGGGMLVLVGLSRRSLPGVGLAAVGGSVAYHAMTGHWPMQQPNGIDADYSVRVNKAVTINRPAEELYRLWRDFENLPRFMSHLESVTVQDGKRSHWVASAPLGKKVEWDAEIINEEENRLIAWRSVGSADVESAGSVRFEKAPGDRGTEVHVKLEYMPPGGVAGAMFAKLFQEEPGQQIHADLHRLKQILEAGEAPSTEGQPRGG